MLYNILYRNCIHIALLTAYRIYLIEKIVINVNIYHISIEYKNIENVRGNNLCLTFQ